jgi:catechol 2,3-dioxygenase-like lactoylglutathione lyase family enzyme
MWVRFDGVTVAVAGLESAVDVYARLLGREPLCFEDAAGGGARFQLGNGALELRAAADAAETGPRRIALGIDDAGECRRWLAGRGFEARLEKRDAQLRQGGSLARCELELDPAQTRGVRVAAVEQIEPEGGVPQAAARGDEGAAAAGLDHIVVRTPDADAAIALYRDRLGIRLALDRSFPERGTRLSFLRIAGVTLELATRIGARADGDDSLWGIAYQVSDPRAARERVATAGFDISELRRGNKPGTTVCTVRSDTCGVPTLLIGPDLG